MILKRIFIAAALIAALGQPVVSADVTVIEGRSITPPGASPVGTKGKIFKLTVTAASEASPAFKYRFTVPPHETISGNAITHYLRSLGEKGLSQPWEYIDKETEGKVDDWYSLSTKSEDIPLEKLKLSSSIFDSLVNNHLRRATVCRDAEWNLGIEDLRGPEAISFLLPSVQNTRMMARSLMLQTRLAIIEKRFDDAVERLRMTYQLGHNVNEMGVLVSSLVAIAEVGIANDGAMLLIGEEGSPNLYWAFAELPTPVIDCRRGLQLDLSIGERLFPEIMDIENISYSDGEWKRLLEKYSSQVSDISGLISGSPGTQNTNGSAAGFMPFLGSISGYSSAKRRLIEHGYKKNEVSNMCVAQVILTDAAIDLKYYSQLCSKSWYVPYPESDKINRAYEAELRSGVKKLRLGAIMTQMISPAISSVRAATIKPQAKINLLMAIESLRNHAAVHGKFPQALNELELPVRDNPLTGKPFNYSLEGGNAVLTIDTHGNEGIQRFEISLKK